MYRAISRIIKVNPGAPFIATPRNMILFDPDLEAAPAPPSKAAKVRGASSKPIDLHLPTARTLGRFLAAAQSTVRLRGLVTVLLTSDQTIRGLNRRFRGKNKATDVLSFPADTTAPGAQTIAGDLAISVPTARRQAAEQGHSLSAEIKVLILHGLLHLAGFDHEADTGQMAKRELLLRGRLRLPQGLIERAAAPAKSAELVTPKVPTAKPRSSKAAKVSPAKGARP
jgi:probable rRNA maturation factor